jgi:hypothetical protein
MQTTFRRRNDYCLLYLVVWSQFLEVLSNVMREQLVLWSFIVCQAQPARALPASTTPKIQRTVVPLLLRAALKGTVTYYLGSNISCIT